MTTLIAVYTSQGCVGRCDAKCYDATHPTCMCVCGGRNHGAGLQKSMDTTRDLAQSWIKTYATTHQLTDFTTEIHEECQQPTLWKDVV